MSSFFLTRPIFAAVLSAIILTAGLVALPSLPIGQFPQIQPPTVTVSSTYPGANATQVESAVTTPIEEAINGAQGLRYLTSVSGDDGTSAVTATFDLSRPLNDAATDVLIAEQQANGVLPSVVKTQGVTVRKVAGSFVLILSIYSDDPKYDTTFISNYAALQIVDPLKRVSGVGDISIFGQRTYAMRLWLDPKKMADYGVTSAQIASAVQAQNVQVPAGAFGAEPTGPRQPYYATIQVQGQLAEPKQFDAIIIKATPAGGYVRLSDVGYAQLGAELYSNSAKRNGKLAIALGVQQIPTANALAVSDGIKARMAELAKRFPPGVHWALLYDTTDFVRESISEVVFTLIFSIALVVLVIYIFLQDWRTTLIPAITIPVSLIGTFGLVGVLGFTINTLTLFGLTLATGLVVDDAIVVIENIVRFMHEDREGGVLGAAAAAMKEISGAVVATSLVLLAVFVPVGFFPGVTGQLYKQFALTIACSIAISLFVALTLTPALTVLFNRSGEEREPPRFFAPVNRFIDWLRAGYATFLGWLVPLRWWVVGIFVASLGLTALVFTSTPTAFLPAEDLGYFFITIQAPQGTPLHDEQAIGTRVESLVKNLPAVATVLDISGRGVGGSGNGPNVGFVVPRLKPWGQRKAAGESAAEIIAALQPKLSAIPGAKIIAFNPPAVQGIGSIGGFQYELEDPNSGSLAALYKEATALVGKANASGSIVLANTTFSATAPHDVLSVDREKAESAGVNVGDVFDELQSVVGQKYLDDFTYENHVYHVYTQGQPDFRSTEADLQKLYVQSASGAPSPVSDFVSVTHEATAPIITHYNIFRSIEITGQTPPGVGSGTSLGTMTSLSKALPNGFTHEWSGISLEQIQGGGAAAALFALGLLFVFFVLAAQYESLTEPFIILLATPVAILGALAGLHLRGLASDVYAQVGYVLLIGLASKNAILIVEFANQLRAEGLSARDAVVKAAEIRLRPILMTSLAFVFGIVPLVVASGAGAASRHSLGTAILGGMIVSTILNLAIIPALYVVVAEFGRRRPTDASPGAPHDGASPGDPGAARRSRAGADAGDGPGRRISLERT